MILVIADATDHSALWLRGRLASLVSAEVRVVTPIQLLCARSIVHRLGSGATDFSFEIADGERIDRDDMTGVINRLVTVPTAQLARAAPGERCYAEEELHAFLLGWLASLDCPVLNPPSPDCLAGSFHGPLAIRQHAAMAGLYCDPVSLVPGEAEPPLDDVLAPSRIHFVLDGRLIGQRLPTAAAARLIDFARLWGTRLLQIQSTAFEARRRLVSATSFVDYRLGGDELVREIAGALR